MNRGLCFVETVVGPFDWRPERIGTLRALSGRFLITGRDGIVKSFVNGRIVLTSDTLADVYLYDPPIFLKHHRHGRCLQLLRPNEKWFKVHFEKPPRDFSAAYMYVEHFLTEAYWVTH